MGIVTTLNRTQGVNIPINYLYVYNCLSNNLNKYVATLSISILRSIELFSFCNTDKNVNLRECKKIRNNTYICQHQTNHGRVYINEVIRDVLEI